MALSPDPREPFGYSALGCSPATAMNATANLTCLRRSAALAKLGYAVARLSPESR